MNTPSASRAPTLDHHRRLSVAPMMDCTDRHARYLLRLISRDALLYTEMVTTGALLHGPRERLLAHSPEEHPVALQLGGSEPAALASSARLGEQAGYDEINLNVGCPSDRVKSGRFGACLMAEPALVADCIAAMQDAVSIPVTIKTRTGIDRRDGWEDLSQLLEHVVPRGCTTWIIHARKAWLDGLSPKENRDIPPLQYDVVYKLKQLHPDLNITLNGGVHSLDEALTHLEQVDGVMLGRAAYHTPAVLLEADQRIFGRTDELPTRGRVITAYLEYMQAELARGTPLRCMARHLLGLYQGEPGARRFRRHLSEHMHHAQADTRVVEAAVAHLATA